MNKIYTPEEVSDIFSVAPLTVRTWLKSGQMKGIKTAAGGSGRWRITEKDLNDYIEDRRRETQTDTNGE